MDDGGYLCAGHGWPVLLDVALDPCGEGGGDPGQHEHHGDQDADGSGRVPQQRVEGDGEEAESGEV